jgi:hypothetical protein
VASQPFPHVTGARPLIVVEGVTDRHFVEAAVGRGRVDFLEADGDGLERRFRTLLKETRALTPPAVAIVLDADDSAVAAARKARRILGLELSAAPQSRLVTAVARQSLLARVDGPNDDVPVGYLVIPPDGPGCLETMLARSFPTQIACLPAFEECTGYEHDGSSSELEKRRWAATVAFTPGKYTMSYPRTYGSDLNLAADSEAVMMMRSFVDELTA